jgi:hypothetical protein
VNLLTLAVTVSRLHTCGFGANLFAANLFCANLFCANLFCANLFGANLFGANRSLWSPRGVEKPRGSGHRSQGTPASVTGVPWRMSPGEEEETGPGCNERHEGPECPPRGPEGVQRESRGVQRGSRGGSEGVQRGLY